MTVFDVFQETPYTFLEIKRGQVYGNRIVSERELMGIFKGRIASSKFAQAELEDSSSTLHVHPEDFEGSNSLLGNGVRVGDTDYEIIRVTEGMNYDTGVLEHYTLTLEVATYA